jgi:hypothetical protein
MDEIEAIYDGLGMALPAGLAFLTPAEYAKMSPGERDKLLENALKTAKETQTRETTKTNNLNALKQYDAYPESVRVWLAGGAARLAAMRNGTAPTDFGGRANQLSGWMAGAGTDAARKAKYQAAFVKMLDGKDAAGVSYVSRLQEAQSWIVKNPGVLEALQQDPKRVFGALDAAKAANTAYTAALKEKEPAKIFGAVFDPGTAGQLTDLYSKYGKEKLTKRVQTGTKQVRKSVFKNMRWTTETVNEPVFSDVSAWDKNLDVNQDGLLDDPKQVIQRMQSQTSSTAGNHTYVNAKGEEATSVTDIRDAVKKNATQVLTEAQTAFTTKKAGEAWNEGGFGSIYNNLVKDLGPLAKEFPELQGLDPAKFFGLGKDGMKKLRDSVAQLRARVAGWNGVANARPQEGTPQDKFYREIFGTPPSRLDYLRAGDTAKLAQEMRSRYAEATALTSLESKVRDALPDAKLRQESMAAAVRAARGQLPGIKTAQDYLNRLNNKPAPQRKEEVRVMQERIPNPPRGSTGYRGVRYVVTLEMQPTWDSEAAMWRFPITQREAASRGWTEVSRRKE